MKKVLFIVAAAWVLAFIWQTYAHAASPTIPPELRGVWCKANGGYYAPKADFAPSFEECTTSITLHARSIDFEDGSCPLVRIKPRVMDNVGDGGKVHGKVNLPEGIRDCDADQTRFFFSTASGSYGYRHRRLYFEEREQESAPELPKGSSIADCNGPLSVCLWRR